VFRWLEEGWEDVVWVCTEAEAVVRAVVADVREFRKRTARLVLDES
jgi:hypothetical protein